jgi:DNA-directed RNA polymerase subunit F
MENELESFSMEGTHPVTVSEARSLLESQKERILSGESGKSLSHQKEFMSTLHYTEVFGKLKSKSHIEDLRNTLSELKLSENEIALIGSLLPQSSDEARILIPSLNRLDDETLGFIVTRVQGAL